VLRAYIAQREGFLVRLEGTNEEKNQISDWIRWAASTQIRLIPATVSAVTQNRPLMVEIKGFKTSHSMGVKTALIGPITAGREGHVECPESEPANDDIQFSRSRMVSAPDCTRTGDRSRDRWPIAGEQVNSTITTHVLLAVVRRDDQRLESQLRQSRGRDTGKGWVMTTLLKIPLWAARWVYRRMGRNCPRVKGTGDLCKIYQERGQPYGL
jgi:hypothetical protein